MKVCLGNDDLVEQLDTIVSEGEGLVVTKPIFPKEHLKLR